MLVCSKNKGYAPTWETLLSQPRHLQPNACTTGMMHHLHRKIVCLRKWHVEALNSQERVDNQDTVGEAHHEVHSSQAGSCSAALSRYAA